MSIKGYKFRYRPVTDPASDWIKANDLPLENPDFTYTGLASGTDYELQAQAVDNAGNEGSWSASLMVSTPTHTPADDPLNADDAAAVTNIITKYKGSAAGAQVATVGPKGYFSTAVGTDYTDALTIDDKMRFGSNTKMYTAVLVFQQIDLGHLSLDDTLDMFIDGIKNNDRITIRHLLQQTTGIPEYLGYVGAAAAIGQQFFLHPTSTCDYMALIRSVAGTTSNFEPGTAYEYSNSNSRLLGKILEILDTTYGTSRDIRTIFQEELFDPLGLTQTEWPVENSAAGYYMTAPYSRGYADNPAWATMVSTVNSLPLAGLFGWLYWMLVPALSGGWPAVATFEMTAGNTAWAGSSGCVGGTVGDMMKFGKALAAGTLLSAESQQLRKEIFTTYARYTPQNPWEGPGWMGAGLGVMSWGQWKGWIGAWLGYNTCLWYNDTNGAVIAVTANWYTAPSWDMFMRLAYQLYPETTTTIPEWILRSATGFAAEDEFGTGRIYIWHATGDSDGRAELAHKVPFYL